ncbi:phage tail protein [Yersinia enterocolitica]|uniref:phage tail protein n=1 Tax=Yersinia enterocolitica TaxID=630 RepID=UPI003CFE1422
MANEILPFGLGAESNVMTQAEYEALAARSSGFSSGVAKSEQLNKVWRQSSFMASVLADFIAKQSGNNVLDDGNAAALLANLELAIKTYAGNNLPEASLTQKGIVQLSSSVTSTNEALAATPKAVKTANDAALQKLANLSDLANVQTALTNLGLTGIGIGLPTQLAIVNFDFQNFTFTSGANYLATSTNWINPPAGVTYPSGLTVSITVTYVANSTNYIAFTLRPHTVTNSNYRVYEVISVGAPGSRVFTVREEWNSANKIPASGTDVATNAEVAAGIVDKLVNVPGLMSLFSKRSFSVNDYIRIPDVPGGLIIQFGTYNPGARGTLAFSLPIPFPSSFNFCSGTINGTTGSYGFISTDKTSLSTFTLTVRNAQGVLIPAPCSIISIGY